MIGPSSLPRCSTELFEASVALARREGVGLQTHLLSGKAQVMGFLVGQVMKRSGGRADPKLVQQLLRQALESETVP